jgi:hypothetical protein
MPPLFVATLAALFITTTPLPAGRTNVVNQIFSFLRTFQMTYYAEEGRSLYKANQFMKGSTQLNFNLVAIVFILIPCVAQFIGYVHARLSTPEYATLDKRWYYVALMFGWVGTIGLGFFLIPVTRHSVLLVALGWSPVHALNPRRRRLVCLVVHRPPRCHVRGGLVCFSGFGGGRHFPGQQVLEVPRPGELICRWRGRVL